MFKIYRMPEPGEFFLIGGDCSQGGEDSNEAHFLSKTKLDIPIVYRAEGVASNMTDAVFPFLEWIYDMTGVKPVVAFERNMGGSSEMERLVGFNKNKKYTVFVMPKLGSTDNEKDSGKLGWDTNTASRPKLIGDWKDAIDKELVRIYDEETIAQHRVFVVNKQGKPEAAKGKHDDAVIAPAVAWQLYQFCNPVNEEQNNKVASNNRQMQSKWAI